MGLDAHVNRSGVHEDTAELSDRAVSKRIGNIALVRLLREQIEALKPTDPAFPILLEKVLYSGTHGGDEIPTAAIAELQSELDKLEHLHSSAELNRFIKDMRELCAASTATRNPIVF